MEEKSKLNFLIANARKWRIKIYLPRKNHPSLCQELFKGNFSKIATWGDE